MLYQAITPTKLGQAAIGIATSTLYTVPASTRTFLKDIDIANTTATTITITVYIGAGATTANALLYQIPVRGNSTLQWAGNQILNAADTIQVVASATGCTISASGGEAV